MSGVWVALEKGGCKGGDEKDDVSGDPADEGGPDEKKKKKKCSDEKVGDKKE